MSTVSVAFQGVADGLDAFLSQLVVAIEIQFGERVVGADHAGHVLAGLWLKFAQAQVERNVETRNREIGNSDRGQKSLLHYRLFIARSHS